MGKARGSTRECVAVGSGRWWKGKEPDATSAQLAALKKSGGRTTPAAATPAPKSAATKAKSKKAKTKAKANTNCNGNRITNCKTKNNKGRNHDAADDILHLLCRQNLVAHRPMEQQQQQPTPAESAEIGGAAVASNSAKNMDQDQH
ncbi:hypothetical protein Pelo_10433 [Pelomyxa schiedti]|nr:hypothetical protein Pelo_10433 [Pelomyxa schiedti]